MSLDFYLYGDEESVECVCNCCDDVHLNKKRKVIFHGNITHNLTKMADAADIYMCLWRHEEIGIITASQMISPLVNGLLKLKNDPEKYKKYDSSNGWGLYVHFVPFVERVLKACEEYPNSTVEVSI